jgi:Domain of unknown function (DUF4249)
MKIKILLLNLLILLTFNACIDTYESFNIYENKRGPILVVDGLLTNDVKNPDTLKFQYSTDFGGYITTKPVASVKAKLVLSSTGKEVQLKEITTGAFLPPSDFRLILSEKYTLKFTIDNQQYESSLQQITPTPPIAKISDLFNEKSRLSADGKTVSSASEIYIDYQDAPNQKNYYLWRYVHYEKIVFCISCSAGSVYAPFFGCRAIPNSPFPAYDYRCTGNCYDIFRDKKVNVSDDRASDGRLVMNTLIAKIPYYSDAGCLVEVQQMCVSPDVYAYNRILQSQSSSTGGLADTPPTAIAGNIINITNPQERVVGFFGVVDIQKKRYWLNRNNAKGRIEYILGRPPVEDPGSDGSLVPTAPCSLSSSRTPITPEGWQ